MNCHCGARLESKTVDDVLILRCTNPKCEGGYRIPLGDRLNLVPYNGAHLNFVPAAAIPASQEYRCKENGCGSVISKEQAVRTYELHGKALCIGCEEKMYVAAADKNSG